MKTTSTKSQAPITYCQVNLDQIKESGLLSESRMAEVEAKINSLIEPVYRKDGTPLANSAIANEGGKFMLYPRLDQYSGEEHMKRNLLVHVLAQDELRLINDECLSAQREAREAKQLEAAEKISWTDWGDGVGGE